MCCAAIFSLSAQDHIMDSDKEHGSKHKNIIGVFAGNTVLYQSNLHLPTIGVEYIHEITPHFGVGVISEVEIGYHVLENKNTANETSILHRESAFLIAPAAFLRVYKGLIAQVGLGVEFEHQENLLLMKLGVEYKLEMKNPKFYILPSLSWDHTKHLDGVVYGVVFAGVF